MVFRFYVNAKRLGKVCIDRCLWKYDFFVLFNQFHEHTLFGLNMWFSPGTIPELIHDTVLLQLQIFLKNAINQSTNQAKEKFNCIVRPQFSEVFLFVIFSLCRNCEIHCEERRRIATNTICSRTVHRPSKPHHPSSHPSQGPGGVRPRQPGTPLTDWKCWNSVLSRKKRVKNSSSRCK